MQIEVIPTLNEKTEQELADKTVVVIDVLRATSNIVTGLSHGCVSVIPVKTIQQAWEMKEAGDLLGGERNCERIAGFDLGNSPSEYMSPAVRGRKIVMTTTNGTSAISKARKAKQVFIGSFLNASACAAAASASGRDVMLLCSGTQGQFSLEDGLCAGLIGGLILRGLGDEGRMNDFGLAMEQSYRQASRDLSRIVLSCANGIRLSRLGCKDDVLFCCQVDAMPVVPVLDEERKVCLSALPDSPQPASSLKSLF